MIKLIVGLGNPGPHYYLQRHNIGFRIIDALCHKYDGTWKHKSQMEQAEITIADHRIILIKPLTFMNSSGTAVHHFFKSGIVQEQLLVIHDELEKPFGNLSIKSGGSHKGHNGLKSIIQQCGSEFFRLRFGIGRPANKDEVPTYVLNHFSESKEMVDHLILESVKMIINFIHHD